MKFTKEDNLEHLRHQLGELVGIADGYHDIWGNHHKTQASTRDRILDALELNSTSAAKLKEIKSKLSDSHWSTTLLPVHIHRQHTVPLSIPWVDIHDNNPIHIRILGENDFRVDLKFERSELPVVDMQDVDSEVLRRFNLPVQSEPDIGYYQVEELDKSGAPISSGQLIIVPSHCWWPDNDNGRSRFFGVGLQLYSLKSNRNWGIGDFTDLKASIGVLAEQGVDVIGLNPLHALLPEQPQQCSPYFPSSRYFINPLYLDPAALPEFDALPEQRKSDFRKRAASLATAELIDYSSVASLKYEALNECFEIFHSGRSEKSSSATEEFNRFVQEQGSRLQDFAEFEARLANNRERAVEKSCYLQWHCHRQLNEAANLAKSSGLEFGLYADLAVGCNADGADVNSAPELYLSSMEIGAPPDDFSPQGQSWGLPPMSPIELQRQGYKPFIDLLRQSMQYAGLLRIDHVMGLMHQFWIPSGMPCSEGVYVKFPLHDLLGIVALESQRHRCAVVGEDLGTVPDELRDEIAKCGMLATRLLYFEKNWDSDHTFKSPNDYPAQAVVTIGGHDLATLYGFWCAQDLLQLQSLNRLGDSHRCEERFQDRQYDRERLLHLLRSNGIEPEIAQAQPDISADAASNLAKQVYQLLGRTPSSMLIVQLTDVFAELEQINVPGTVDECPNWRRKLALSIEHWTEHSGLRKTLESIRQERA